MIILAFRLGTFSASNHFEEKKQALALEEKSCTVQREDGFQLTEMNLERPNWDVLKDSRYTFLHDGSFFSCSSRLEDFCMTQNPYFFH